MKTFRSCWSVVGVVMLVLSGCAVVDVERNVDLSSYKSFGWGIADKSHASSVYRSELIDANIKSSIKAEFVKKGLTYTPKKPDLVVSYEVITEQKESSYGGTYYYYPYYPVWYFPYNRYMMMGWPMPYPAYGAAPTYYTYTLGTLILDVRDRRANKLIWRGVVRGNVDNLKTLNKTVARGVRAIMKRYPAVKPAPSSPMPIVKDRVS